MGQMMLGHKEKILKSILSCPLIRLLMHTVCFDDDDTEVES